MGLDWCGECASPSAGGQHCLMAGHELYIRRGLPLTILPFSLLPYLSFTYDPSINPRDPFCYMLACLSSHWCARAFLENQKALLLLFSPHFNFCLHFFLSSTLYLSPSLLSLFPTLSSASILFIYSFSASFSSGNFFFIEKSPLHASTLLPFSFSLNTRHLCFV